MLEIKIAITILFVCVIALAFYVHYALKQIRIALQKIHSLSSLIEMLGKSCMTLIDEFIIKEESNVKSEHIGKNE